MHSHFGSPKSPTPVEFRRLPRGFHSVAKQASFYIAFWMDLCDFRWILGGFGEAKASQKLIFGRVFGDAFFEHVLASILGRFFEARNLKNRNFP